MTVMVARAAVLALAVTAALALSTAGAAAPRIAVTPGTVHRGHSVRVHGVVDGCPRGDQVTLISKAFSHRHDFAGLPAVYAAVGKRHAYSVTTRIPRARKAGRYTITGRCGGGNLGVKVMLRVLA
jgi:hypothetical protein